MAAPIQSKADPFRMGKLAEGDFRNPLIQNQFRKRYEEHPMFDELGYSPFRDNETLFNDKDSTLDQLRRGSGAFASLAGLAIKDAFSWSTDITDQETAREFEEAMAVGNSTEGGIGGFTTNLFVNSGYTMGIMAELAAEELVMMAAEAGLGALAVPSLGATTVPMAVVGATMTARAVRAGKKIAKAFDYAGDLRRRLDQMENISKTRKLFNKGAGKALDAVNPFGNTADFFAGRGAQKFKDLNNLQKTAKGAFSLMKDVRNVKLAWAESSMEGGMIQNQLERDLMVDFRAEHGRGPTAGEATAIRKTAAEAGKTTTLMNAPLILLSNKLTLDGLIRSKFRGGASALINSNMVKGGRLLLNPANRKAAFTAATDAAGLYAKNPKMLANALGRSVKQYAAANVAEGLQEVGQETVGGASADFYTSQYKGDVTRGGYMDFLAKNLNKQVSPQGFETFMSGFLMQTVAGPIASSVGSIARGEHRDPNTFVGKAAQAVRRGTYAAADVVSGTKEGEKSRYEQEVAAQEEQAQIDEDLLNKEAEMLSEYYDKTLSYFSEDLENLGDSKGHQKAMQDADKRGDELDYNDHKDEDRYRHMKTIIKHGRTDTFLERLEGLKKASDEEIAEEFPGMSKENYLKKIESAEHHFNKIKGRYDQARKLFGENPFDYLKYRHTDKGDSPMETAFRAHQGFERAFDAAVYDYVAFDRALERREALLGKFKDISGLKNVAYGDISSLASMDEIKTQLKGLDTQIESLAMLEGTKSELNKVNKKRKRLAKLEEELGKAQESIGETGTPRNQKGLTKAYTNYLQVLADESGDFVNKNEVEASLRMLVDSYVLTPRAVALNANINSLLDPENFLAQIDAATAEVERADEEKREEIKASLKAFRESELDKDMINELMEAGMFFEVDEILALKNDNRMPDSIKYHQEEARQFQETSVASEDYKKAISIISAHYPVLNNIKITELDKDGFYMNPRVKDESDKRTYEDLATQYGFDPKSSSSAVPLKDVLQSIIDSEYSDPREVALAQRYLDIASDQESVTFRNNLRGAGEYSAENASQVVIDPRYSAEDHVGTKGFQSSGIEHNILRYETARRISAKLSNEGPFKETATQLFKETTAAWNALSKEERIEIVGSSSTAFEGLKSVEDFVQEAMVNPAFQQFLGTVKTEVQEAESNAWKDFMEAVIKTVKDIFSIKGNLDGTVLNATIRVVSTNIDKIDGGVSSTVNTETGAITKETDKSVLLQPQHKELLDKLLVIFKRDYKKPSGAGIGELTDDYEFDEFIRSSEAIEKEALFAEYNKERGIEVPTAAAPVSTGSITTRHEVTREEVQDFKKNGPESVDDGRIKWLAYALERENEPGSLRSLTPNESIFMTDPVIKDRVTKYAEGVHLRKSQLKDEVPNDLRITMQKLGYYNDKGSAEELAADANIKAPEQRKIVAWDLQRSAKKALDSAPKVVPFNEKIEVEKLEWFRRIEEADTEQKYNKLSGEFKAKTHPITGGGFIAFEIVDEVEKKLKERLDKLGRSVNFELFKKGDIVTLDDAGRNKATVMEIDVNNKTISLKLEIDSPEAALTVIEEKDMSKEIKYRYSKALDEATKEGLRPDVEITPKEQIISKATADVSADMDSPAAVKARIAKAKETDTEDLRGDANDQFKNMCS